MQIGLKNRLRLISLLPIVILFSITSYYVYNSYENYKAAQFLQNKLDANKELNSLVNNISRERGMTVMYLGNSSPNTLKSLIKQRKLVDEKATHYFAHIEQNPALHDHTNGMEACTTCNDVAQLRKAIDKIRSVRTLVDAQKTNFKDVYEKVYGKAQRLAITQLEEITQNQLDMQINDYSFKYLSLVHANEYTASERDYISFAIARSTELEEEEISAWVTLISKADAIEYATLKDKELKSKLDALFNNEDNKELFDDINIERAAIMVAATSGE